MRKFNRDNRSGSRRDFGRGDFGRRSFAGRGGEREMYQAICSNCGRNCEVPFEPTGNKPVYCNECFRKNGGRANSRRFQDRNARRPDYESRNVFGQQSNQQLELINRKLDKMLEILTVAFAKEEKETKAKPKGITIVPQKKTKTSKKKTPVIKE